MVGGGRERDDVRLGLGGIALKTGNKMRRKQH